MTTDHYPLFANTCGKIFTDQIVFASSKTETGYKLERINKISFKKRIRLSSIVFACLPSLLIAAAYFSNNEERFIRLLFIILGIGGTLLCLFLAKMNYSVVLETVNGNRKSISVWHGNKKDALKFVEKANAAVANYKANAVKESRYHAGFKMAEPSI